MIKFKILTLLVLLAMVLGMAACGGQAPPTEPAQLAATDPVQTFKQEVERLRKELNIPGISVAVLQRQEIVFARGFGYADVENEISATENTPYYIASCTKPFAAAVIMQLVEVGQLDLDAAMTDILNDATFPFPTGTIYGYASLCEKIMFTPTLSNGGQPLPYGMGWFVQEHEGVQLIWHYGQQTTYSSLILKVPEEELTLLLLANSDGASAPFDLGTGNVLKSPFAVAFITLFTDIEAPSL